MCLILFAWKAHKDYPLVVAANRDEFFARPTAAAEFWAEAPTVLAGRDLEAGGTWMGISRQGRFAALTNYRAPEHHIAGRPSRGKLVADFLTGRQSAAEYVALCRPYGQACNGYNLLLSDGEELYWTSNISGESQALEPGIYGLSNHLLNTPWPKVGAGRAALNQALTALPDDRALFHLLGDDTVHPDAALPRTGVPLDWERLLSAAFIRSTDYGTRASTVFRQDANGGVVFDEQTWLRGGVHGERRRYRVSG